MKFKSSIELQSLDNATVDTDKFLVSDGDVIKFRTGAQVLSDIGAQAALTNPITGTGTAGQVSFWNGTNSQTGDSGFTWDNVNKRLGIGLNNPSDKLYIRDNQGGANANFRFFGNVTSGYTAFLSMDNVGVKLGTATAIRNIELQINNITQWSILTNGILQSNGAQTIRTSGTEALTFQDNGGNTIFGGSGNVGIGTGLPNFKLHIEDSTNAERGLRIRNSSNGTNATSMIRINNDSGNSGASQVLMFLNSSTRTNDGGTNAFSIRNNIGSLRLMSTSGGEVSLWTSSSSERMRITSAGNVGINEISPSERLHINGRARITTIDNGTGDFATISGTGVITRRTSAQVLSDIGAQAALTNPITGTGTRTTNFMPKFSGTNTITNSQIFDNGTSVGIGTNSPAYKLDVNGSLHSTNLNIADGIYHEGDTNTYIQFVSNDTIRLVTNGSERLRVNSAGNVGIGTITPTQLGTNIRTLDIKGSSGGGVRSGVSGGSESTFYTIAAGGYLGTISNIPLYFQTNNSVKATILANGNVGIGTTSPLATLDLRGNYYQRVGTNSTSVWQLLDSGGTIKTRFDLDNGDSTLQLRDSANTYTIKLDSAGTSYIVNNVGIGITATSEKLTVADTTKNLQMRIGTLSAGLNPSIRFTGKNVANTINRYADIQLDADNGVFNIMAPATTSPTVNAISVLTGGNVGIGTTTPAYKLDVNGSLHSTNLTVADNIIHEGDTNTFIGFPANDTFRITTSGQARLTVDSVGRVGIGTLTPSYGLDVGSNIRAVFAYVVGTGTGTLGGDNNIFTTASNNAFLNLKGGSKRAKISIGNDQVELVSGNDTISFRTGATTSTNRGTERVRITSTGNVGIGTTNPQTLLHLHRTTSTAGNEPILLLDNRQTGTNNYYAGGVWGSAYRDVRDPGYIAGIDFYRNSEASGLSSSGELRFYTTTSAGTLAETRAFERMRIDKNGNVGIGTVSPSFKLDVSGTARATSTITATKLIPTGNVTAGNGMYLPTTNTVAFSTNGGERLRITAAGAMGLGKTPTNTSGRFEATNDIVAFASSDIRWKTNIKNIDSPLDKISKLNGVTFDWIEDEPIHGNKGHDIGVIAQEVEKVLPEIVDTRDSGMKAVKYEKLIPLLIESIKDQQNQINELKQIINGFTK